MKQISPEPLARRLTNTVRLQIACMYVSTIRGHPFMTSTRRGGGGEAQVDACGRGKGIQPHVDVHT